jgi:hypothetical protein
VLCGDPLANAGCLPNCCASRASFCYIAQDDHARGFRKTIERDVGHVAGEPGSLIYTVHVQCHRFSTDTQGWCRDQMTAPVGNAILPESVRPGRPNFLDGDPCCRSMRQKLAGTPTWQDGPLFAATC